jgi:hypothetical protein
LGAGFYYTGGFLSAGVKGDVGVSGHGKKGVVRGFVCEVGILVS